jgi:flavodoxin short chain
MADVLLVYWSGTGNTEIMAENIYKGLTEEGVSVDMKMVDELEPEDVSNYDKILFGCPSMGEEQLEETEFEPFFEVAETLITDKKVALFGSYGWGEGDWMEKWEQRVKDGKAILFRQGLMVNYTPGDDEESMCVEFGKAFASF